MAKVETQWTSEMSFDSTVNNHRIVMDSDPAFGGKEKGPRPKMLVLSALGGCTGMDVVSILNKMRVTPDSFRVIAEADIADEHPKVFTKIHLTYEFKGKNLFLGYYDPVLSMQGELNPDLVVLSTPVIPEGNKELGQSLRLPVTKDGFFMEAHLKLRPLDFATEGVFLCGMAHYPKFISETISQANGAAVRAATVLSRDTVVSSGAIAEVQEDECIGCGLCANMVPDLFEMQDDKAVVIVDVVPAEREDAAMEAKDSCPVEAISIS